MEDEQKFTSLVNKAKKEIQKYTENTHKSSVNKIFAIYGELKNLLNELQKKNVNSLFSRKEFVDLLDTILSGCICYNHIKTKKLKHILSIALFSDIINCIVKYSDDTIQHNLAEKIDENVLIPLTTLTGYLFPSRNFAVPVPILYICPSCTFHHICSVVSHARKISHSNFNFLELIENNNLKQEIMKKLIELPAL